MESDVFPYPRDAIETRGVVSIGDRPVHYTATAGHLPIYDNLTGALAARLFFVAYHADNAAASSPRPLTFVWNGGPGSNCLQLHLLGFGPQAFGVPTSFPDWTDDLGKISDNPDTWLEASDLVFIDPIGAGYSRATSQAWLGRLMTTQGDAETFAEAIRVYVTRRGLFRAPIFLAGESYGTFRAMSVAHALERRRMHVSGLFLLSGFLDTGQTLPPARDTALQLPTYTAAAHYHGRLPADLQLLPILDAVEQARHWAEGEYATLLAQAVLLGDAMRDAGVAKLERFTGIPADRIDRETLTMGKDVFADRLLEAEGLELGRYDLRMTARRRGEGEAWSPFSDPSIAPMVDMMQGTLPAAIGYLRNVLKFSCDLLYQGPFGEAFLPEPISVNRVGFGSDWTNSLWDNGELLRAMAGELPSAPGDSVNRYATITARLPDGSSALLAAMRRNPRMQVYAARGLYDMSCAALDAAVSLAPVDVRARIRSRCIASGHVPYSDRDARRLLTRDFCQFVMDAVL